MTAAANKAVSRRFVEEVWSEGRLEVIGETMADDVVIRDRDSEEIGGVAAVAAWVGTYRRAFPDIRLTVHEQVAERDRVVTHWTAHGTHRGELMGIPPTEKSATVTGLSLDRVVDGRIVESTTAWDALGMLGQLGILAQPTAPS